MFALLDADNLVIDIAQTKFPVAAPLNWEACDETIKPGDLFAVGVFSSVTIAMSPELLFAAVDGELLARTREGVTYDGRRFSVTSEDRNEIAGILEGARNGIEVFGSWGGMNAPNVIDVVNGKYPIADFETLRTWSTVLFALSATLYNTWNEKKAQVRGLTTQAELDAFDPATGWPEVGP